MPRHTVRPRTRKSPKSTLAARRLIRAALTRHGTQSAAARALHLPNQAQLRKMLTGEIGDTPSMKAALARAAVRARRAYNMIEAEDAAHFDTDAVLTRLKEIDAHMAVIWELLGGRTNGVEK